MKLLYILNVADRVNSFAMASVLAVKELNIQFHIAGNWGYKTDAERMQDEKRLGITIHQIDFIRSPLNPNNAKAYKQLKALIKKEGFDAIHCNTPIGGILGRLAANKLKIKRVIYQAHGFHFYKGAPFINHAIYYPIEKLFARKTHALITINQEDYCLAKSKFRLKNNGRVYYVPGVGIDTNAINNVSLSNNLKEALGLDKNDIIVISMGDLIKRKNYNTALNAISLCQDKRVKYIICGTGEEESNLKGLAAQLNISDRVLFLGYRSDVISLLKISDIFLITSLQEGMPRSLMEAMAAGLPCVASSIRGNTDLAQNNGVILCPANDSKAFADAVNMLSHNIKLRESMGELNTKGIAKYSLNSVKDAIKDIYLKELLG